jgi:hypothetical protein
MVCWLQMMPPLLFRCIEASGAHVGMLQETCISKDNQKVKLMKLWAENSYCGPR